MRHADTANTDPPKRKPLPNISGTTTLAKREREQGRSIPHIKTKANASLKSQTKHILRIASSFAKISQLGRDQNQTQSSTTKARDVALITSKQRKSAKYVISGKNIKKNKKT
jgi:hypothetical protein